ncbi:hypothetical protein ACPCUK_36965, partial [Streptomyces arboris]
MSQPPSQEPQQEGFKAPQDPPHGTLQPPQVHQSPAGPPQTPPPGEPAYGYPQQQYPGAPAPAGSGPIKGKTGILATAVAVVLLVGTGAWYVVSDSGDAPKKPVAGPSDDTGGRQAGDDLNTGRK